MKTTLVTLLFIFATLYDQGQTMWGRGSRLQKIACILETGEIYKAKKNYTRLLP